MDRKDMFVCGTVKACKRTKPLSCIRKSPWTLETEKLGNNTINMLFNERNRGELQKKHLKWLKWLFWKIGNVGILGGIKAFVYIKIWLKLK